MKFYWLGANLIFALFFAGVINAQAATCPTDNGGGIGCSNPALPYYCNGACSSVVGPPSLAHCSNYVVNSCVQSGGCTNAATTDCGFTKTCVGGYSACTAWPNTICKANVAVPSNCKTFVQCSETCTACNDGYELNGGVCLGAAIRLDSSSVASDRLKNSINVSPSMSIFGSGNVAIGTTSALYRLFVAGNSAMFDYPVFVGAPTANDHAATKNYVDSAISLGGGAFWSGTSTGDIWNLNSGGIAVGTTTASGEKFAITGGRLATIGAYNMYSGGQIFSAGTGANAFAGRLAVGQMGVASPTFYVNGGAGIGTAYSTFNIATGTLAVEGGIGIGITNPVSPLEINKNTGAVVNSLLTLTYSNVLNAGGSIDFNTSPSFPMGKIESVVDMSNYASLRFYTRNNGPLAEWMRITGSGNIGIGTTTPSEKLEIIGKIKASNFRFNDALKSLAIGTNTTEPAAYTTSVGFYAGSNNSGGNSTLMGHHAGDTNSGASLSAFGYSSGVSNTGSNSTFIGYSAGQNNTGNNVVAIGYQAALGNATANQFIIKQASVNAMPLIQGDFSSGNVGIGTTTLAAKLSVSGGNVFINDASITSGTPKAAITKEYLDAALLTATSTLTNLWGGAVGANIWALNSGNIGIGLTAPTQKLHVSGSIYTTNNLFMNTQGGSTGISWYTPTYYTWFDYMKQGGAVSTPSGQAAPSDTASGVTSWARRFNIENGGSYGWIFESGSNSTSSAPTVKFAINAASGTFHSTGNALIDGNVGIGTISPNTKLEVAGNMSLSSPVSTPQTNYLRVGTYTDGNYGSYISSDTNYAGTVATNLMFGVTTAAGVRTEAIRVVSSGNVGIGTTTPTSAQLVIGTSTTNYTIDAGNYRVGNVSSPVQPLDAVNKSYFDSALAAATSSMSGLWGGTTGGNVWSLNSGNVGIGTTNPIYGKLQITDSGTYSDGVTLYAGSGNLAASYLKSDGASDFNWHLTRGGSDTMGLIIKANGNVGIGATNPVGRLDVSAGLASQTAGDLVVDTANNIVYIGKLDSVSNNTNLIFRDRLGNVKSRWENAGSGSIGYGNFGDGYGVKIQRGAVSAAVGNIGSLFNVDSTGSVNPTAIFMGGNVGFGTTTPSALVHIASNNGGANFLKMTDLNGTAFASFTRQGSGVNFSSNYNIILDPLNAGNVGISTTTPGTRLTVVGSGNYSIDATNFRVGNVAAPVQDLDAVNKSYMDSALAAATSSLSSLWGGTTGGNVWSLNSGNVGIGVTNPGAKFQIGAGTSGHSATGIYQTGGLVNEFDGPVFFDSAVYMTSGDFQVMPNLYFSEENSALKYASDYNAVYTTMANRHLNFDHAAPTNPTIYIHSALNPDVSNNQWVSFTHDANNFNIITGANTGVGSAPTTVDNGIIFSPRGSEVMRILGNGNVGIGTTTPDAKLAVNGGNIYINDAAITSGTPNAAITKDYLDSALSSLGGGTSLWNVNGSKIYASSTSWMVGVGTTNPMNLLQVRGALTGTGSVDVARFDGGATVASGGLVFTSYYDAATPSSRLAGIQSMDRDGNYKNLLLNLNGGNVGIGLNVPDAGLHVVSGASDNRIVSFGYNATIPRFTVENSSYNARLRMWGSSALTYASQEQVLINTGGDSFFNGGNVGIGTTTPDAMLSVHGGNIFIDDAAITAGTPKAAITKEYLDSALSPLGGGASLWNLNGSTIYASSTSWMVGIGTTTPDSMLNIAAATAGDGGTNNGSGSLLHLKQLSTWTGSQQWALFVEGYSYLNGFRINGLDTTRSLFQTRSTYPLGFATAGDQPITFTQSTNVERMRIAAGGNVGIGTTTPDAKLAVNGGNIFINDAAITAVTPKAAITKDYLDSALSSLGGGTSLWNLNGSTIYASSTAWNVGIGTTTPMVKLDVNGGFRAVDTSSNLSFIFGELAGVNRMRLYATGPTIRFLDSGDSFARLGFGGLSVGGTYGGLSAPSSGAIFEGNVGIGTTTPTNTTGSGRVLHLYDTVGYTQVLAENKSTTGGAFFAQKNDSGKQLSYVTFGSANPNAALFGVTRPNNSFMYTYTGGALTLGTLGPENLTFGTNSVGNMTIKSGGYIGIGTSSPDTDKIVTVVGGNIILKDAIISAASDAKLVITKGYLDSVIDALPSTGGMSTYATATPSAYNGARGGYSSANALCNATLAGTHVCTSEEILNTINSGGSLPPSTTLWINSGPPGYTVNANDCIGWTNADSSSYSTIWVKLATGDGFGALEHCNNTRRYACCQ